jgi:hypothetical protein
MNEEDWLVSNDPQAMLNHLEGKASSRKLRLFACACARRSWPLLLSPRARQAVQVAERFADGLAGEAEVAEARGQAELALMNAPLFEQPAYLAALATVAEEPLEAARQAAEAARRMAWSEGAYEGVPGQDEARVAAEAVAAELRALGDLLRHIAGNPFRPATIDPAWLRWSNGTVATMARVIYDAGRLEELPFLADALTDAGCGDEAILAHFRCPEGEEHPRGCWLLDALLHRA